MKIFVASAVGAVRSTFLTAENAAYLESLGNVVWYDSATPISPKALRDALENVDVCVCGWGTPRFDAAVLQKANRLRLIAYLCGSVSGIVSDELFDREIGVVSGNDVFAQTLAEGTLAYMLAALRRIPQYSDMMQETGWHPAEFDTQSLIGKSVGIIGLGETSRYLIDMLKPFRVRIKLFSRHLAEEDAAVLGVEKAELSEIFSACDIISLHCARNAQNYHLVSEELLRLMKQDALLVNTARGDIVDEAALAEHLKSGHIRAILDVYETEPLPMDSRLRHLQNCILIPHMGGPTIDRRRDAARIVLEDIRNFKEGLPLRHEVTRTRAARMTK